MAGRPRRREAAELAQRERLLELVSNGDSLSAACEILGVPRRTARSWLDSDPDFAARMVVSEAMGVDLQFDRYRKRAGEGQRVVEEAAAKGLNENAAVTAWWRELDALKWELSKRDARRFGDRVATEITGAGGTPLMQSDPDPARVALSVLALLRTAARPRRPLDEILPPPPPPDPDPEVEARRLQAARTGAPLRSSLGTVDAPLPEFNPSPAPRRAPVEDLIDLDIRRRARKVQERIAPYVLKTWPP